MPWPTTNWAHAPWNKLDHIQAFYRALNERMVHASPADAVDQFHLLPGPGSRLSTTGGTPYQFTPQRFAVDDQARTFGIQTIPQLLPFGPDPGPWVRSHDDDGTRRDPAGYDGTPRGVYGTRWTHPTFPNTMITGQPLPRWHDASAFRAVTGRDLDPPNQGLLQRTAATPPADWTDYDDPAFTYHGLGAQQAHLIGPWLFHDWMQYLNLAVWHAWDPGDPNLTPALWFDEAEVRCAYAGSLDSPAEAMAKCEARWAQCPWVPWNAWATPDYPNFGPIERHSWPQALNEVNVSGSRLYNPLTDEFEDSKVWALPFNQLQQWWLDAFPQDLGWIARLWRVRAKVRVRPQARPALGQLHLYVGAVTLKPYDWWNGDWYTLDLSTLWLPDALPYIRELQWKHVGSMPVAGHDVSVADRTPVDFPVVIGGNDAPPVPWGPLLFPQYSSDQRWAGWIVNVWGNDYAQGSGVQGVMALDGEGGLECC